MILSCFYERGEVSKHMNRVNREEVISRANMVLKKQVSFKQFNNLNDKEKSTRSKKKLLSLRVISVSYIEDSCILSDGGKCYIADVVKSVIDGAFCITNPSKLKQWKGFTENQRIPISNETSIDDFCKNIRYRLSKEGFKSNTEFNFYCINLSRQQLSGYDSTNIGDEYSNFKFNAYDRIRLLCVSKVEVIFLVNNKDAILTKITGIKNKSCYREYCKQKRKKI